MKKFLEKIENINIGFGYSILIFCFAIFLRTFLENFTNLNNMGMINGFIDTFFHYPLWFFSIFLGLIIIIYNFTKKPLEKIFKVVSFSSIIIILPPILDIIFYGHKILYNFITGSWVEICKQYFSLFINTPALGVGIKIEVIIILISIFYYVYIQNKNILKAILAAWLCYTVIFAMLILPDIVYIFSSFFSHLPKLSTFAVQNFYFPAKLSEQVFISRVYLSDAIFGSVRFGMSANLYSIILSQASAVIFIIFSFITSLLYFGLNKIIFILKNFRWLRISHYMFLFVFGILFLLKNINIFSYFSNIYNLLSFILLAGSLLFAWLFAVWENDEADRSIDIISNPDRPLNMKIFSNIEWKNIKWIFFVFSIILALLVSYSSLILILVFIIIYHLYSVYPFRLKKYTIISSVLIGVNACICFLLGFLFIAGDQPFNIMPMTVLLGILIFYLCVENIKNLKDVKGDAENMIKTIPVIFGEKKGQIITWLVVTLGTFAVPFLIFPNNILFFLVPILGVFSYFFIVKDNYKEKPLFIYYLVSFVIILFLNFII